MTRSSSGGGCIEPRDLAQLLSRSALFYAGTTNYGVFGFLEGYGRPDLTRIVSEVPSVRVDSAVTKAWAPGGNAPDGFKVKGFLVRLWYGPGVRIGSVTGPGQQRAATWTSSAFLRTVTSSRSKAASRRSRGMEWCNPSSIRSQRRLDPPDVSCSRRGRNLDPTRFRAANAVPLRGA